MRGRKPKPTALRLIEGVPGKSRPVNLSEPDAGPIGQAPGDLDGAALAKWHEMVQPDRWGLVLTGADREQMAEYCRLEARRVVAEAEVQKPGGMVSETAGGQPVRSAWMVVLDKTREDMRKIAIEFGGTPASRTRVKANDAPNESKFGNLLAG